MHDEHHGKNKLCSGHAVSSSLTAPRAMANPQVQEDEPPITGRDAQPMSHSARHKEHR